jgi:hypothetical protein
MIYLHSGDERQRKITDALGELAEAELRHRNRARAERYLPCTWHAALVARLGDQDLCGIQFV